MTCSKFEELLSAFLSGEPLPAPPEEADEHLKACAACRKRAQGIIQFHESLVRSLAPLPRGLGEHIRAILGRLEEDLKRGNASLGAVSLNIKSLSGSKTRRFLQRRGAREHRLSWTAALVAAGLLMGFWVVAIFFGGRSEHRVGPGTNLATKPASPEAPEHPSDERAARRIREEATRREMKRKEKEAEERVAALRREEERLAGEQRKADETQQEDLQRKAEEAFKAVATARKEAEDRLARLKATQAPPLAEAPKQETTRVALASLFEPVGEVYLISGVAKRPAKAGDGVAAGEGLETVGGTSQGILRYPDGTRLQVGPETVIRGLGVEKGKRVVVEKGTLEAEVAKQPAGQPMVIETPHGEATVLGTTLRIVVDPDPKKGMRLEVEEGKVRLKSKLDGKAVDVPSGHYAVAAVGVQLAARPKDPPVLARLKSAGEVMVRFGPERLRPPEGVFIDSGGEFTSKRGYGWLGPNEVLKLAGFNEQVWRRRPNFDPGKEESDLHASRVSAGGAQYVETWVVKVPDGRYLVSVSVGRYAFTSAMGPHHVRIQSVQAIDAVITGTGEFVEKKDVPVVVSNGEIRVVVGGHRRPTLAVDPPSDTALNYIMIKKAQP